MRCRSFTVGLILLGSVFSLRGWADDGVVRAGAMQPPTATTQTSSGGGAWSLLRDAKSFTSVGRLAKSYARSWVIQRFGKPEWRTHFGLDLDADWQKTPVEKGLVVFIHGYQSVPEKHSGILKEVRAAGIPCALLRYPNDQPLEKSADLLANELRRVAAIQPERKITILALSMGGLIARAVVENPALDPGNVARLIMVATPNQGSQVASYAIGADLYEFLVRSPEGSLAKRLYASIEDGLGEAAGDLRPGSDFLRTLNARKRNPKVRYSLFLGTGGAISEQTLARWHAGSSGRSAGADRDSSGGSSIAHIGPAQSGLMKGGRAHAGLISFLFHEGEHLLAGFDEVMNGKGDGAVAVKRGQLEGVEETVVLGFIHYQLMDGDADASRQLRAELLKRLLK